MVKEKKGMPGAKVTTWTLNGPADQSTNLKDVLFTQLSSGVFGWVKNKAVFV
jgi:hypothetical protein